MHCTKWLGLGILLLLILFVAINSHDEVLSTEVQAFGSARVAWVAR